MSDLRASIRQAEFLIDAITRDIIDDETMVERIEDTIASAQADVKRLKAEIDQKRKLQRREQALLQKLLERYRDQPRSR